MKLVNNDVSSILGLSLFRKMFDTVELCSNIKTKKILMNGSWNMGKKSSKMQSKFWFYLICDPTGSYSKILLCHFCDPNFMQKIRKN